MRIHFHFPFPGTFRALMAVCLTGALGACTVYPPIPSASAQAGATTPMDRVTPENYIRAETDRTFYGLSQNAGGVNRWYHLRSPTPLDRQAVVRMNRDTLYSSAIVDTSKGATVTVPPVPVGRYMAVQVVDNDHYTPITYTAPGTYELPRDTKYVAVLMRIQLFNPRDAAEIAQVNQLQNGVVIQASNADPLPLLHWDAASLQSLTNQYKKDSLQYTSWKGMMGPRGQVDEATRHIAAAAAWGLNPERDATYLNYVGEPSDQGCYKATYPVPENQAFWSITVYGRDGYMKSDNAIINASNVKLNPDRTFTVFFGSKAACGGVANRLDISEGWNFLMRVYRPGPSVLDGTYTLPRAERIK